MGGLAFRHMGLHTPRMALDEYQKLSQAISAKLQNLFKFVRIPRPTPEKTSYGDLDFLVQDPYTSITAKDVQKTIGASHCIKTGHTWNFAVPSMSKCENMDEQTVYRQVDIHICNNNIEWEEFLDSYGDLWTILGTLIRMFGFLCDNKGFHLLVSPIDKEDKQASKVLLTKSSKECLDFLDLDVAIYENGFQTVVEMFDYIRTSKIFTLEAFSKFRSTHSDKMKARQRPVYSQWLENYIPTVDMESCTTKSRAELEQEAINTFGKEEEVRLKRLAWNQRREEKEWWASVANTLPLNDRERNVTVRALKKKFFSLNPPLKIDTEDANHFIQENWEIMFRKSAIHQVHIHSSNTRAYS